MRLLVVIKLMRKWGVFHESDRASSVIADLLRNHSESEEVRGRLADEVLDAWAKIKGGAKYRFKEKPWQPELDFDPAPSRGCENCLWWERCPRFHFDGRVCHRFRMRRT